MTDAAEPTKRCPDCAETILAAANKCRYCGYRFAEPPTQGLSLRRARRADATLEELLETWGDSLLPAERAEPPVFARLGKVDGYLLVTDRRVAFFGVPVGERRGVVEHLLHPPEQRKLAEMYLTALASVAVAGWPRSVLVLRGHHETFELGGLTRAQTRGLAERLRAAIDA
jgi:Uncharacterised protein family UPF0547